MVHADIGYYSQGFGVTGETNSKAVNLTNVLELIIISSNEHG
jgi:hypothetical protein